MGCSEKKSRSNGEGGKNKAKRKKTKPLLFLTVATVGGVEKIEIKERGEKEQEKSKER